GQCPYFRQPTWSKRGEVFEDLLLRADRLRRFLLLADLQEQFHHRVNVGIRPELLGFGREPLEQAVEKPAGFCLSGRKFGLHSAYGGVVVTILATKPEAGGTWHCQSSRIPCDTVRRCQSIREMLGKRQRPGPCEGAGRGSIPRGDIQDVDQPGVVAW